jgi:hypothetical protein
MVTQILKRHVKNTNHHILDRAFLQHINILQTVRLHLERAFGVDDPVYQASLSIRESAPRFFSSTILGVANSFAEEDLISGGQRHDGEMPLEGRTLAD